MSLVAVCSSLLSLSFPLSPPLPWWASCLIHVPVSFLTRELGSSLGPILRSSIVSSWLFSSRIPWLLMSGRVHTSWLLPPRRVGPSVLLSPWWFRPPFLVSPACRLWSSSAFISPRSLGSSTIVLSWQLVPPAFIPPRRFWTPCIFLSRWFRSSSLFPPLNLLPSGRICSPRVLVPSPSLLRLLATAYLRGSLRALGGPLRPACRSFLQKKGKLKVLFCF